MNKSFALLALIPALATAACGSAPEGDIASGDDALTCAACAPVRDSVVVAPIGSSTIDYGTVPNLLLEVGTCIDPTPTNRPLVNSLLEALRDSGFANARALATCVNGLDERIGVWLAADTNAATDARRTAWLAANRRRKPAEDFALSLPAATLRTMAISQVSGGFPQVKPIDLPWGQTIHASIAAPSIAFGAPATVTSSTTASLPLPYPNADMTSVDTLGVNTSREVLTCASAFHFNATGTGVIDSALESTMSGSDKSELAVGCAIAKLLPVIMLNPGATTKTRLQYRRVEFLAPNEMVLAGAIRPADVRIPALDADVQDLIAWRRGVQGSVATITKETASGGFAGVYLTAMDLRGRPDQLAVSWTASPGVTVSREGTDTPSYARVRSWSDFRFGDGAPRFATRGNGLNFKVYAPFVQNGRPVTSQSVTFTVTDAEGGSARQTITLKPEARPTNCAYKPMLVGCE